MKNLLIPIYAAIFYCLSPGKIVAQEVGAPWVVPPVMDVDDKFEVSPKDDNTRFLVSKKGAFGVFDRTGQAVLPIEYGRITLYSCGWMAAYNASPGKLFNARVECISLPYDRFIAFNNGTAVVYKNNLCGLVNMAGEELVPVAYERYKQERETFVFTKSDGERRFDAPPEVVPLNLQRVEDAKARSVVAGHYFIKGPGVFSSGLLNLRRDTVVPPIYRFDAIHPAGYMVGTFDGRTFGVIDTRHKTLYPFTAERMGKWTKSGLLPVRVEKKWGLLRFPSGEVVFPFGEFEAIEVYDPNRDIFLVTQNKLQGLIDLKRKVLLPCAYTYISQYDHVTTELVDNLNKHGFWHRPTGYLQAPAYKNVGNLGDSLVIVAKDSTYALMDARNGKLVIPFSNFQIERVGNYFDSHKPILWRGRLSLDDYIHGLYDRKGNLVVPYDTADIVIVPKDNTIWICYPFMDSSKVWEHRTLNGKVLATIPKKGADLKNEGYYVSRSLYGYAVETAVKMVYTDAQGREKNYEYINGLKENLHRVKLGNFWGCVDANGKVVIEPVFEVLETSKDGYIKVKYKGKWGVLKNPKFDYFEQFEKSVKK